MTDETAVLVAKFMLAFERILAYDKGCLPRTAALLNEFAAATPHTFEEMEAFYRRLVDLNEQPIRGGVPTADPGASA